MKNWIIGLLVVVMIGFAGYDFYSKKKAEEEFKALQEEMIAQQKQLLGEELNIGLKVGDAAPDIVVKNEKGEDVLLSDFKGEPVILNFWATWCPPCRAEMPDMQQFHEDTQVNILSVNLIETEKSEEHVPEFIKEYGLTFDVYYDEQNKAAQTYKIQPIPTTYFIDKEGFISFAALGAINYETMAQELKKIE